MDVTHLTTFACEPGARESCVDGWDLLEYVTLFMFVIAMVTLCVVAARRTESDLDPDRRREDRNRARKP